MNDAIKRWVWRGVRAGVCAVALWWVLRQLNWDQVREAWKTSDATTGAIAFLIFLPVPIIQSMRFVWMLRAQDIPISYWESLKLNYTGNFFNMFVPAGAVGGDLVKAYYVAQHTTHRTEAITAVFLDRVVGLFSFVLFAAVGLALKFNDPQARPMAAAVGGLLVCLGLGACVVFSHRLRQLLRLEAIVGRLPLAEQMQRVGQAMVRMREHKTLALSALAATLVLQGLVLASFTVAAAALGMRQGDTVGYFAYLSLSLIVAAIPISPGGLGTMEMAMKRFFVNGGYGNLGQVLLLAMAMRVIQLFWALPGFAAYLTGACRPDASKLAQLHSDPASGS